MARFTSRRIPLNETPEQKRVREDREEIANVRTRSMANRGLTQWKVQAQEDWELACGKATAKATA